MRASRIACIFLAVVAVAAVLTAGDSRTYERSIELTWDEAVKAIRDAELKLTDSKRSDHWFTMVTPKKSLAKTVNFEVRLTETGGGTQVSIEALDNVGSKRASKGIIRYLEVLDKRMR